MAANFPPLPLRTPHLVSVTDSSPMQADKQENIAVIGDLLRQMKGLTVEQIQQVVEYQRVNKQRFGDAAVALGLASNEDVLFALSQQFHYPYAPENRRSINPQLVAATQPFSQQAESIRAIRGQLMMKIFAPGQPKRALAIVSPNTGDGKTFFTSNLGVSLAQLGNRVLVIDADLRGPRLHEVFGLPNTTGLSSILSGRRDDNVIHQAADIPSLYIMPVGITPPNPLELIERPAFRLMLSELLRKFDHVLVDTPALEFGTDALLLASKCGSALMVARKNRSRVTSLQEAVTALSNSTTTMAGVIVNEY
jgi:chain length determinant protein tyrosine kinase EpsG